MNWYSLFKPLTTILVILIPIIFGNRKHKKHFFSVVLALVFCLIGDVFLLDDAYFTFGLSSFLLAHILFAYSFVSIGGMKYNSFPLVLLLLIAGGFYSLIQNTLGDLSIPVAVYIFFIVFMCWQGLCLYLCRKEKIYFSIAVAAILFLISDSILAVNKFYAAFEMSGILVLLTYWLSILILANSTISMKL